MERNGVRPAGSDTAMRTDLFDFDLSDERIALEPAAPRDAASFLRRSRVSASGKATAR